MERFSKKSMRYDLMRYFLYLYETSDGEVENEEFRATTDDIIMGYGVVEEGNDYVNDWLEIIEETLDFVGLQLNFFEGVSQVDGFRQFYRIEIQ